MKTLALIALAIALSACDDGKVEYGYSINPKGIFIKILRKLRMGEVDEKWQALFSGRMACYYGSEEGQLFLKKTLGHLPSAPDHFTLEQPVLVETNFNAIPSFERYQVKIIRNATKRVAFTVTMSCFKENSNEGDQQHCVITDLMNHRDGKSLGKSNHLLE